MARNDLPPLDKLDPVQAWQPWEPSAEDPWNLKWAGHLFRRAALGPAPPALGEGERYDHLDRLREAVQKGLHATLDQVCQTDPRAEGYPGFEAAVVYKEGKKSAGDSATELRGWWLRCLWYSPQPLREKLTLFWHNHFATSVAKVQKTTLMFQQHLLLREHAAGKFGPFLQQMSKDPAMLIWLDSNSNVKGKPNENYARELMELFSLGVGNYTEKDVQEAARAFTGWHADGERFRFSPLQHDDGEKTVFGHKGNWDGDDIVRFCLKKDASARFLARKLYRAFVSETAEPPAALLEPLADSLRKSDYDVGRLVKTMLRSRLFFSGHAYRQRIKGPVEFVLGAARDVGQGLVDPRALANVTQEMGQLLFAPPNVKGWEGGRAWLNTATLLARHNFAQALTVNSGRINLGGAARGGVGVAPDPAAIVRRQRLTDPKEVVRLVADFLLQGDLAEPARGKLADYLAAAKPDTDARNERVRDVFHAVMTMPEYQLA